MVKVEFKGKFSTMYRNLTKDDAELRDLIADTIRLFEKNPDDTRLDNHALTRKMSGKWAFRINDDIRIVYEWVGNNTVRFLAIGSHKEVYPKQNL